METQRLKTKVELFMSGRGLKNLDTFSKSDPYCIVSMFDPTSNTYLEGARTEVINNNLNPDWQTTATVDYYFELQQAIRFTVYDYDDKHHSDHIGSFDTTLGYIVGKGTTIENIKTSKGHRAGKLIIRAEEVRESRDIIWMQLCAHHVDKMDFFGKSDPYLIIYRVRDDGTWLKVHKTETIKNTLNPIWKPFEISGQQLCNGDEYKPLKIECWDWDRNSSDDFIGSTETTLQELLNPGKNLDLINPEKRSKKKYKNSGVLEVQQISVRKVYSFIDYLRGGTQFSLMVAIDFTGSNGDYTDPRSLHYLNPNVQNEYEKAIWAVGAILDNYDPNKMYPAFGFGGRTPWNNGQVDHCFPLNGNRQNPFVPGIPGIIQLYHQALSQVGLSGPTLFQHIIRNAINIAASTPRTQFYHVLLILTDGEIHDMDQTIANIVEASNLPLSIIIVGLGNDDFRNMEILDSDDALLRDRNGRQAVRDIVQFVPFRKFGGNPYLLAQEVLAEIPKQITGYMQSIGHIPIIPELVPMGQLQAQHTMRPAVADPEAPYIDPQAPQAYNYSQTMPPQGIIPQNSYQNLPPKEIQSQYQTLPPQMNAEPCAPPEEESP